jgi:transposase
MTPRDEEADRDPAVNRLCHSVTHVAERLDVSMSTVRRLVEKKYLDGSLSRGVASHHRFEPSTRGEDRNAAPGIVE